MLSFEKEKFTNCDPFTGILETQIEEMKKHREAMEEKFKEMGYELILAGNIPDFNQFLGRNGAQTNSAA